jgi:hypothetical protein
LSLIVVINREAGDFRGCLAAQLRVFNGYEEDTLGGLSSTKQQLLSIIPNTRLARRD